MNENVLITLFFVILFAIPMIYHSIKFHGVKETFYLLLHIVGIAVIVELIGVTSGAYTYTGQTLVLVTIFVGIGWIANTYPAYHFSVYLLNLYEEFEKFNKKTALIISITSGLFGVIYDLFIDPVAVMLNVWEWPRSGPWFGVPIANFIGWFFIIFSITAGYLLVYLFTVKKPSIVRFVSSLIAIALGAGLVYFAMILSHILGL
ncbi:MAG: carotenoid biosynthesis protein [Candidatus Odinarchaeota archaeon]|nr:carotenoid biosynthesis protein [Candidatus Odinarchaeota archaeon]